MPETPRESTGLPSSGQPPPPSMSPLAVDPAHSLEPARVPTGSSVLDEGAVEEYGRTYHHYKADAYLLPNDGDEQDRLDLQHHVVTLLMDGKLAWAPLDQNPPRRALDLGTGTGIWAIQFARQFPDCQVTASDLSSIQPKDVVPNVEFVREDAEDEWTFNHTFDYIHARLFCAFVTDFKDILKKAYDHLEPGGWIELQDVAFYADTIWSGATDSGVCKVLTAMVEVMMASGRDPFAVYKLTPLLKDAGFIDIEEKAQPWPFGDWPEDPKYKQVGKWNAINGCHVFESAIKYLIIAGKSQKEAHEIIRQAQHEVRTNKLFSFSSFHVIVGRKPPAP